MLEYRVREAYRVVVLQELYIALSALPSPQTVLSRPSKLLFLV